MKSAVRLSEWKINVLELVKHFSSNPAAAAAVIVPTYHHTAVKKHQAFAHSWMRANRPTSYTNTQHRDQNEMRMSVVMMTITALLIWVDKRHACRLSTHISTARTKSFHFTSSPTLSCRRLVIEWSQLNQQLTQRSDNLQHSHRNKCIIIVE